MFVGHLYLVLDSEKYFYKGYENNYNTQDFSYVIHTKSKHIISFILRGILKKNEKQFPNHNNKKSKIKINFTKSWSFMSFGIRQTDSHTNPFHIISFVNFLKLL